MNNFQKQVLVAVVCAASKVGGEPINQDQAAEFIEIAMNDPAEAENSEVMLGMVNDIFKAMLPMPREVGEAIREAIQTECGEDVAAGVHECEAIWKAAIGACMK